MKTTVKHAGSVREWEGSLNAWHRHCVLIPRWCDGEEAEVDVDGYGWALSDGDFGEYEECRIKQREPKPGEVWIDSDNNVCLCAHDGFVKLTGDSNLDNIGEMDWFCGNGKPVSANMIFNPGDSLVRASVEDKAEWDGEGLPPVGTVCECAVQHQDFLQFEIRGYFDGKVWMASAETGDIAEMVKCCEFRPIKSHKEKAIEEMLALDPDDGLPKMLSRSEFCGILYDAKYRIQESDDE